MPDVTAETLSIATVHRLRDEANAAGDEAMANLCDLIISGEDGQTPTSRSLRCAVPSATPVRSRDVISSGTIVR